MQFTDNAGPDQPAHKCRLIKAFVVCISQADQGLCCPLTELMDTVVRLHGCAC